MLSLRALFQAGAKSPAARGFYYFSTPWQDLVEGVLALLGLKAEGVGENESLALLGIDSMQLMEARPLYPFQRFGAAACAYLQHACSTGGASPTLHE
jgi:hypothetical protein